MSELYDVTTSEVISRLAQMEETVKVTQIKTAALDGTIYIQNIGTPETDLTGDIYVDRDGKAALQSAYSDGDTMRVTLKHGTYYGRIIGCTFGARMAGDYFKATLTLTKEAAP
jgi:hypothetical protein